MSFNLSSLWSAQSQISEPSTRRKVIWFFWLYPWCKVFIIPVLLPADDSMFLQELIPRLAPPWLSICAQGWGGHILRALGVAEQPLINKKCKNSTVKIVSTQHGNELSSGARWPWQLGVCCSFAVGWLGSNQGSARPSRGISSGWSHFQPLFGVCLAVFPW